MKVDKQRVWLENELPGWEGMMKHIEKCGRVSWKSEDRITEDSWRKFIKFLYNKGHWAVFNLGTAYLKVPNTYLPEKLELLFSEPWTKIKERDGYVYITTNYRVLCQLGIEDWMEKFWHDFDPKYFFRRVTVGWYCSRVISEEIIRHASLRPLKESTRYVNYGKFGDKEIHVILPQYAYQLRDELAQTIDPLTGESRAWIKELDGEKLWNTLTVESRWAASRDDFWRECERQYFYELSDECNIVPEIARGVLPLDLACTFYTTGYLEDFYYTPPVESPEKAGFFNLRCDKACHRDLRVMAYDLRDMMNEKGYENEWKNSKLSLV